VCTPEWNRVTIRRVRILRSGAVRFNMVSLTGSERYSHEFKRTVNWGGERLGVFTRRRVTSDHYSRSRHDRQTA
jgi:hypothetical protein